ncbi:hypothetical protein [Mesorhizobium sp.]|uniref:hypothetical protein n=1 Tax=Mesorhizobium sp. TaxID=1871066 RepID=UPI00257BBCEC|nr:hypothetical protein [Mesorhizobium sp.]
MSKTVEAAPVLLATSATMWLMNALVFDGRVRLPDSPTTRFFDIWAPRKTLVCVNSTKFIEFNEKEDFKTSPPSGLSLRHIAVDWFFRREMRTASSARAP